MNKIFILIICLALFTLFGCVDSDSSANSGSDSIGINVTNESKCVTLCKMIKDKGTNMENGPCLGLISTDWVCDIAHNPRQSIDNLLENRCKSFADGEVHHFVEVDTNCKVIQVS
jgi:hypothetical protein